MTGLGLFTSDDYAKCIIIISLTTAEQACKLVDVGAVTMQLRLHGSHNMGCTEEPQNNGQFGTSTTIKFCPLRRDHCL